MLEDLLALQQRLLAAIAEAGSDDDLEQVRLSCLGRKGELTQILRSLGTLAPEQRKQAGEQANRTRETLQRALDERVLTLKQAALADRVVREQLDVTLPGRHRAAGAVHPITRAIAEIGTFFQGMGFIAATGPEVESDWYNFEALNLPPNHPAREMQDTFYLPETAAGERLLLRTHTSPVQIHVMEQQTPPLRVIAPGRVFRCDSDLTHTPMFHQVEGFMVDETVHFGHLKGLLAAFLRHFFARELPVRFRPSFFPFTEPSAEVDMGCLFCQGKGCRVCKGSGWLEVLGCGMIHPAVLGHVGIDRERYSGFAFGMGVERLAMLKYGIGDLRTFFDNDVRFLQRYGAAVMGDGR
ncbi:MAG: phenylalanine--tRNA ligase subunit alpha [Magnetococcales bacterium]|nr:phenylalanine--tRNA ligase subunit alpha [Magnetococcales bacterium]